MGARSFPCFITVHFRSELHVPSIEIQFCVQDAAKVARRIILDLPASGSSIRRPKQVDFDGDPPRNGWMTFSNGQAVPEVTYMPEPEAEPPRRVPKSKAGAKAKSSRPSRRS